MTLADASKKCFITKHGIDVTPCPKPTGTRLLRRIDLTRYINTNYLYSVDRYAEVPEQYCVDTPCIVIPSEHGRAIALIPNDGERVYINFKALVFVIDTDKVDPMYVEAMLNGSTFNYDADRPPYGVDLEREIEEMKSIEIEDDIEIQKSYAEPYEDVLKRLAPIYQEATRLERELFEVY